MNFVKGQSSSCVAVNGGTESSPISLKDLHSQKMNKSLTGLE